MSVVRLLNSGSLFNQAKINLITTFILRIKIWWYGYLLNLTVLPPLHLLAVPACCDFIIAKVNHLTESPAVTLASTGLVDHDCSWYSVYYPAWQLWLSPQSEVLMECQLWDHCKARRVYFAAADPYGNRDDSLFFFLCCFSVPVLNAFHRPLFVLLRHGTSTEGMPKYWIIYNSDHSSCQSREKVVYKHGSTWQGNMTSI